jgi:class 3 adenylate cyclase
MSAPTPPSATSPLETRIAGSFFTRFWLEFFGNSAHFPVAIILLELLIEQPANYLRLPDLYIILSASLFQAYWLTRWQTLPNRHRFLGNLIGPALYTLIEGLIEGPRFFAAPHHIAYWIFALAIGALQAGRYRLPAFFQAFSLVIESVIRTSILFFMYAIFEIDSNAAQTTSLAVFFSDTSHQFIGLVVLFIGISLGLANMTADRYLLLLRETSTQLRTYSEWLLGRDLLGRTFVNPDVLGLARRDRVVLFMDIRSFTRWSEAQSPEAVVNLLNEYYQVTESSLMRHGVIKFKPSADEVMAVFATVESAVQAALELRPHIDRLLSNYQLGAGIGLHHGPLVEGLIGSAGIKFYDVIGDTVNTAKRIEGAARPAEVLVSEDISRLIDQTFQLGTKREITVKGKELPLSVYPLEQKQV